MSTRLTDNDSTLLAKFKSLSTFRGVAILLDVNPRTLAFHISRTSSYKTFLLNKRTGGTRVVSKPVSGLKLIQKKLNQVLHAVYGKRSPVHGFVRGRSIVTNASRHLHRELVLNFDLENFFPTIHFGRVKGLFEGKPYYLPERVSITLARICCHDAALPIGAPTSPIVANMICAQMDTQLKRVAIDCGSTYTRYADDITFSTKHGRLPPPIVYRDPTSRKWIIGDAIEKVVTASGFKINPSKTRVLPRGYRQEVTGLVVGDRVNVKRNYVRQVRAAIHSCERWGVDAAAKHFHERYDRKQREGKRPDFMRVLRGKIEFIGAVRGRDDDIYLSLMERYARVNPKACLRPVDASTNASADVLARAIWVLEDEESGWQGTAFAAEGWGLITAAHVLARGTRAACPALSVRDAAVREERKDDHVDVARLSTDRMIPVRLRIGRSDNLRIDDSIRVLGYPLHRDGGSVNFQRGRITNFSTWHAVPHVLVDCAIVQGNSGGPVLNADNEVIGIAVKGQGTPKRFTDDDEFSRFVPIGYALPFLI